MYVNHDSDNDAYSVLGTNDSLKWSKFRNGIANVLKTTDNKLITDDLGWLLISLNNQDYPTNLLKDTLISNKNVHPIETNIDNIKMCFYINSEIFLPLALSTDNSFKIFEQYRKDTKYEIYSPTKFVTTIWIRNKTFTSTIIVDTVIYNGKFDKNIFEAPNE